MSERERERKQHKIPNKERTNSTVPNGTSYVGKFKNKRADGTKRLLQSRTSDGKTKIPIGIDSVNFKILLRTPRGL